MPYMNEFTHPLVQEEAQGNASILVASGAALPLS